MTWTGNTISNYGIEDICEVLKTNSSLTELNLHCNKQILNMRYWMSNKCYTWIVTETRKNGAIRIGEGLKTNTTLTSLDLSGNE